ncbi:MAG: hypothetical protein QF477_03945, partial [SAR202 cluster bacterium]|nr:hypothetical protein [SAR202 cluster bacterium]
SWPATGDNGARSARRQTAEAKRKRRIGCGPTGTGGLQSVQTGGRFARNAVTASVTSGVRISSLR